MASADSFMEKVLVFVDRNGTVEDKTSNPMSCSLKMSYASNDLKIKMHAYSHCQGNGSCSAKVTYKGKVVYEASGGFTSTCRNVTAKVHTSGDWEKLIK